MSARTDAERALIAQAKRFQRLTPAAAPTVDIDAACHPKQARLVRSIVGGVGHGKVLAANWGRQTGKSHGGALATNLALLGAPGRNWIYVTSTYDSCRRMAFRPAVEQNRTLALGGDPVDMEMRMPNGSVGYFMGADSERLIERLRGTPNLAGVIIDEAGLYRPEQLRQMIEVVKPGLRPLAGVLAVMGNPSKTGKQGTWYDLTISEAVEQHRADYRDNDRVPSFADVERLIDEELAMLFPLLTPERRRQTAYFLREYMGEFVVDLEEKVYQLTEANLYDGDPPELDNFLSAGDLGVSANDSLVSVGWNDENEGHGDIWVVDQEEASGQDSIACADMVNAHNELRHPNEVAIDPGGLGQKTIKTVQRLYPNVPVSEAEKPPLGVQARATNYLLQGGANWRLRVKRGSKLAQHLTIPTWVDGIPGGKIDEHGVHSDLVPPLRYIAVKIRNYLPDVVPVLSDEEAREKAKEARMEEERRKYRRKSAGSAAERWKEDDGDEMAPDSSDLDAFDPM